MKSFLSINNKFYEYNSNYISMFHKIGTEGFTIYCVLLTLQGQQDYIMIDIKKIRDFINRKLSKKEKVKVGLTDRRTILKYLLALKRNKLIECDDLTTKTKLNDSLLIEVNKTNKTNGFIAISSELFKDNIHKIGHIGWATYCLLFKNHNINFGNQMSGNIGFACCSEDYISRIINKGTTTIKKHLKLLEKCRLIKIVPQEAVSYLKPNGEEVLQYMPNHYIVKAKVETENKYYIEFNKK